MVLVENPGVSLQFLFECLDASFLSLVFDHLEFYFVAEVG